MFFLYSDYTVETVVWGNPIKSAVTDTLKPAHLVPRILEGQMIDSPSALLLLFLKNIIQQLTEKCTKAEGKAHQIIYQDFATKVK